MAGPLSVANVLRLKASTTNIPLETSNPVQLTASTPIPVHKLLIVNTTTSIIELLMGSAGNEVALIAVGPSCTIVFEMDSMQVMPLATRLSLNAIDTAASSGEFVVSLMV